MKAFKFHCKKCGIIETEPVWDTEDGLIIPVEAAPLREDVERVHKEYFGTTLEERIGKGVNELVKEYRLLVHESPDDIGFDEAMEHVARGEILCWVEEWK